MWVWGRVAQFTSWFGFCFANPRITASILSSVSARPCCMSNDGKARLLSSGNPQIPKGEGDGPVQAYIQAMPGWKSTIGRQVDQIAVDVFPGVIKAVKWNTPLYGKEDGWFLSLYCYKKYVQLGFLQGKSLVPPPPKESRDPGTRYLDLHEDDPLDHDRIADWVAQAVRQPGVKL